jgi:hypothetical protein
MGVRGALRRWLLSDDDGTGLPDRDQPPSWPRGSAVTEVNPADLAALPAAVAAPAPAYPPPANGAQPLVNVPPAVVPVAAPPAPHRVEPRAGELVVGNAERRYPPPDLPDFYLRSRRRRPSRSASPTTTRPNWPRPGRWSATGPTGWSATSTPSCSCGCVRPR